MVRRMRPHLAETLAVSRQIAELTDRDLVTLLARLERRVAERLVVADR